MLRIEWEQRLSCVGGSRSRLEGAKRQSSSIAYDSNCRDLISYHSNQDTSVFVEGKIRTPNLGDEHGPHFTGNREGLFSAAKALHNDLWIGAED